MLLDRLRIRGKLALLLAIPLIIMSAFAVALVSHQMDAATRATAVADRVRLSGRIGAVVRDLQQERLLSVGYLLGVVDRSRLIQRTTDVDDRIADLLGNPDSPLPAEVSAALNRVRNLADVRAAVLSGDATPDQVLTAWGPVNRGLINSLRLTDVTDATTPIGRQVLALESVLTLDEGISVGTALIVLAVGSKNPSVATRYLANLAALENVGQRFRTLATAEQNALYLLVEQAAAARGGKEAVTLAWDSDNLNTTVTRLSLPEFFPEVTSHVALGHFVEKKIINDLANQTSADEDRSLLTAYTLSGLVAAILGGVILLSFAVARAIARPLTRLTSSAKRLAWVGEAELVRVVDDEVEAAQPPRLDPTEVAARDEIGDLARAFERVQNTSVRLVERQVASRRNIAQMFGHIGRRTQNLVNRQISLIDRLEQRELDPERLSELFHLDHLSNRLRRNARSLVVLSGARGEDVTSVPVSLLDVVRLALGEVEDYTRIDVLVDGAISVIPAAVGDLILTLGELLENATVFSPPDRQVTVTAEPIPAGVRIDVIDHGIGLPLDHMAEENNRLTRRERLDLAPTEMLGLFVVGRLARRHGWTVTLTPTAGGGVTARVEVPQRLLVPSPPRRVPTAAARASVRGNTVPAPSNAAATPAPQLSRRVPGTHLDVQPPTKPTRTGHRLESPDRVRHLIDEFEAGVTRALHKVSQIHGREKES